MADSIKFTIGGQLGASFKGALSQAMIEARAANAKIQADLDRMVTRAMKVESIETFATRSTVLNKNAITTSEEDYITFWANQKAMQEQAVKDAADLETQKSLYNAIALGKIEKQEAEAAAKKIALNEAQKISDAEVTEASIRETQGALEWSLIAEEEKVAAAEKAATERLAITKASELAMLRVVAEGNGASAATGGHSGGGGLAGIIRESLVIVREAAMGRGFARIAGSVTLLAQYLGLLGKVVKSTAAEAVLAAAAESKLSQSMAATAIAAEAKAAASIEATAAEGADVAATTALAEADMASAVAAREAAVAQEAKAVAAASAARVALASAVVSIGPIGWIALAVVALGAAVAGLVLHFRHLATEAKTLSDLMDPLTKKFTDQTAAVREDAKAHQGFLDLLKKIGEETDTLPEKVEQYLKKLREQSELEKELARAHGATALQLERMDEAQLKRELAVVDAAKKRAQSEADGARLVAQAANAAFTSNPSLGGVDLTGAQRVEKNAGEILDALQEAMKTKTVAGVTAQYIPGSSYPIMGSYNRPANENDPLNTKVGGKDIPSMSVSQAKAAYDKAITMVERLTAIQKQLADNMSNANKTLEEKTKDAKKLNDEASDIQDQLGLKQKYGPAIAAASGKGSNFGAIDWEKSGGSFGGHGISMLDIGKQQLHVQKQIERNTKNAAKGSHENGSTDFGDGPGKT